MWKKILVIGLTSALLYRPLSKFINYAQVFQELKPFRSNKCTPIPGPQGCESLATAYPFVFMACSDLDVRDAWSPMKGIRKSKPLGHQDPVYLFNLSSRDLTPLKLEGYEGEFFTHGMDVLRQEDGKYWLFFINHAFDGDLVNLFTLLPEQNLLKFEKSIKHPSLSSLNSIAAVSPQEFYATNDDLQQANWKTHLEYFLTPIPRLYHVSLKSDPPTVTPVGQPMYFANGVAVDEGLLFVADTMDRKVLIYQILKSGELEPKQEIDLDFFPDNLSKGRDGTIYAVGFPRPFEFLAHFLWSRDMLCSSRAVRIFRSKDGGEFVTERIFEDSSLITSGATSLVVDTQQRTMLLGLINQRHIAICDY